MKEANTFERIFVQKFQSSTMRLCNIRSSWLAGRKECLPLSENGPLVQHKLKQGLDQEFVRVKETNFLKNDVRALSFAFKPFFVWVDVLQIIVIEQISFILNFCLYILTVDNI